MTRLTALPITSIIFAWTTGRKSIATNRLTKTGRAYKSINSTTGLLSHIQNRMDRKVSLKAFLNLELLSDEDLLNLQDEIDRILGSRTKTVESRAVAISSTPSPVRYVQSRAPEIVSPVQQRYEVVREVSPQYEVVRQQPQYEVVQSPQILQPQYMQAPQIVQPRLEVVQTPQILQPQYVQAPQLYQPQYVQSPQTVTRITSPVVVPGGYNRY